MADSSFTSKEKKSLAIVERHAQSRQSIAVALLKALLGLWGGFDQWQDRDMVTGHAARSAILVDNALEKTRRLARTYAKTMLSNADALPAAAMPPVQNVYPRSGSTTVQVYSRPAEQYLWEIKKGATEEEARKAAERRLRELAETDIMLAERDETQRTFARAPKVIGRRRIIHPELAASGFSCGLCVVISERIYRVSELMPVHGGRNCTDSIITTGFDPGLRLNRADLDAFYATAGGSTFAEDLVNVRVAVLEHGELGPIIRREDQNFRTAEDASSGRRQFGEFKQRDAADQRESLQQMIDASERAIALLELARDVQADAVDIEERGQTQSVSDFTTAIKYHSDLVRRYKARLKG